MQNNQTNSTIYHKIEPTTPLLYSQTGNQAEDGQVYYAMPSQVRALFALRGVLSSIRFSCQSSGLTWQIDVANVSRQQFADHGMLTNVNTNSSTPIGP